VSSIFISYRRHDSEGEAGRLFDDLVEQFGDNSVFMDVAAIEVGRDFRKAIDESVATCGVLLAIVGPGWLDARNESGQLRLDDPNDFVRVETVSALRRDVPIIPVLVRGAKMPRPEQLPDDLTDFAYRNCVELTHVRWKSDIKILIRALRTLLGDPKDVVPGRGIHTTAHHFESELESLLKAVPPMPGEAKSSETARNGENISGPNRVTAPTTQPTPPLDRVCGGDVDPAAITRITKELARYIGPIAEIVVKRAAKSCASVPQLRQIVAGEIEVSADRAAFLDSCRDG